MRHLTLLLLSVFTVHQAKADILIPLDKYPTGEKRFNLQINGIRKQGISETAIKGGPPVPFVNLSF